MTSMPGGLTDARPADDVVNNLVAGVKPELEEKLGKNFATFEAISYKSQVVNGTNYFIKVKVGDDDYVHLRIYQALPFVNALPSLVGYQESKGKDDEIEYFNA